MLFDKHTINIDSSILELINRRRRQILVHSYLYYQCNTSLIQDFKFDAWCRELVQLHNDHQRETDKAVFGNAFEGWQGFSGYDLFKNDCMAEMWARHKALQLTQSSL